MPVSLFIRHSSHILFCCSSSPAIVWEDKQHSHANPKVWVCLLKNKCANFEESTEGRACQWKRGCKASLSSVRARHWLLQRGKDESIRPACYAKGCWGDMWWGSSAEFQPLCWFQPKLFYCQSFQKSEIWMHVYVFTVSINFLYTVINTNNEIKESSLDVLKETCDQNYGWTPFNGNPSPSCTVSNWSKKYCLKL